MALGRIVSIGAALCAFSYATPSASEAKPPIAAPAEPKDACKQGKSFYSAGDIARAAKSLSHCVEQEPRNREAWTALANAHLEAGRFPQSADAFARAEALKPGDVNFLEAYLSALEGAGRDEDRIPVLRKLAARKAPDRKAAERLLSAIEAVGPDRHPEEYLFALQILGEGPRAERYHVEKLAAAYLKRGETGKAEAEYRGLLEKGPEAAENWAGLGSALSAADPQAAAECYRKAVLYSNQADQRAVYAAEQARLAKSGPVAKPAAAEDAKEAELAIASTLAPAAAAAPAKPATPSAPVAAAKPNGMAVPPAPTAVAKNAPAPAAHPTPVPPAASSPSAPAAHAVAGAKPAAQGIDLKAYQDSVYRAELSRRLAALHLDKSAPAAGAAPATATAPAAKPQEDPAKARADRERQAQEEQRKQAEEKARQEALARSEKARQDSVARAAEAKARDEKAKQEALAKSEKARKDSLDVAAAAKAREDKAKQEALAKAEKARKDSLDRAAEAKAKDDRAKQEAFAKAEKARKDSLDRAAEANVKAESARQAALAKADQARKDSVSKAAEAKAREDKAKQEALAKADKARKDSLDRAAEAKAKDDRAKQEAFAKAEKARKDSLDRAVEAKAKEEKAKQEALAKAEKARKDSLDKVAEAKAREEKTKQEALAKAEQARKDSLEKAAVAKAKEEKTKQEALAKAEKARKDSLDRVAEAKAKEEKAKQESERLARERRERFDRAYAQYRAGRLDSSASLFKAVLADSPVADAWYYAGRVQLAKGDFPRAYDLLTKGPADKPDLEGLKGKALLGMGKPKEAIKPLEAQYAKDKNDSLLEDIVAAKRKAGDEAGAIVTLEELAARRPGVIKIQSELAAYWRAKGDKPKASARYSRVFILDPKDGEANYWLGMEAAQAGDQNRAASMLERAVAVFPSRPEAWKSLAKADLVLGRKEQAWEAHRKALALTPDDPDLAQGRLVLAREAHPEELAKAYEEVLRLAPGDTSAAMGLAQLRYGKGDYAGAEKPYRIALKDSKDAEAWADFGRTLLELKKTDEAAAALQKAVDLGDKEPALRLDLARIRMDKGDLDGAEALMKDLAKKSPANAEAQYWLGRIALKRQQTQVAEDYFRKAHQLQPDHARYAEALAQALRDKDEFKPALAALSQAEPSLSPEGRLLFGDCLARSGDGAKALEVYAALYAKQPSAMLLSRRMDLLARIGKSGQAVDLAQGSPYAEAAEVRFSLAKAQLDLAEGHVLKGDVDQAVDLMKRVLKTDDHKPEFHYYLGLGYYDQGRWKKALGEFVDALAYRVEYPEALYRKGLSLIKLEDAKEAENAFSELSQHAEPVWKARGLYGLALVFEAQGKPEAIQHHLELSIAAAPLPDAMAALARVHQRAGRVPEAQEWARRALAADPAHEAATVALADALSAAKKQDQAMELARAGLKVKPLSCGLLVQSAKLNFEAGRMDSTLAASSVAMRACPEEPMGYYYAGVATRSSKGPKEAKSYFKTFRKLGGDGKLVPAE
jgi:tetratricopeptide (TPR) repeat protein